MDDAIDSGLPPAPSELDGPGVLARLVDGMGFRYRWATEGLLAEELSFRPCAGAQTLGEVLGHMNLLLRWVQGSVSRTLDGEPEGIDGGVPVAPEAWEDLRADTRARLLDLRGVFANADPLDLARVTITGSPAKGPESFWCVINGPLADFLTHVGQVSSWRRMAGNPAPRADVFRGRAPRA